MDQAFGKYVLGKLAEKNADNPKFGDFVAKFNGLDAEAQKAELTAIASKMGISQQADTAPDLISPQAKLVRDVAQTVSFGQAEKVVAAAQAVGDVASGDAGFGEAYKARRATLRAEGTQATEAYGTGFNIVSNLAGFLVPAGPLGALLSKANAVAKAATASKLLQPAIAGAIGGGGYAAAREAGDVATGDTSLGDAAKAVATETALGGAGGAAGAIISQLGGEGVRLGAKGAKALLRKIKGTDIQAGELLDELAVAARAAKEAASRPSEAAAQLGNETIAAKAQVLQTIDEAANATKTFIEKGRDRDAVSVIKEFGKWIDTTRRTASAAYESSLDDILKANAKTQVGLRPTGLLEALDNANAVQVVDDVAKVLPDALPGLNSGDRAFVAKVLDDGFAGKAAWADLNKARLILGKASDHAGDLNSKIYGSLRDALATSDKTGGSLFNKLSADYHEYLKVLAPFRDAGREAAEGGYQRLAKLMQGELRRADKLGATTTALEEGVGRIKPQTEGMQKVFPKEAQAAVGKSFQDLRKALAEAAYADKPQRLMRDVDTFLRTGNASAELKAVKAVSALRGKAEALEETLAAANIPEFVKRAVRNPNDNDLRREALSYLQKHAPKVLPRFNELHASAARYARLNDLPSAKSGLLRQLREVADMDAQTRDQILNAYDFLPQFRQLVENPKIQKALDKMIETNEAGLADQIKSFIGRGAAATIAGYTLHATLGVPRELVYTVAAAAAFNNPSRGYKILSGIEANAAARSAAIASKLNGPISKLAAGTAQQANGGKSNER